jgi:hypothetical protein
LDHKNQAKWVWETKTRRCHGQQEEEENMEADDMNTPGHGMSGGVCTVNVLLMLYTSLCGAGKIHG